MNARGVALARAIAVAAVLATGAAPSFPLAERGVPPKPGPARPLALPRSSGWRCRTACPSFWSACTRSRSPR